LEIQKAEVGVVRENKPLAELPSAWMGWRLVLTRFVVISVRDAQTLTKPWIAGFASR